MQLLRHVLLFETPRTAARHVSLSVTIFWSLLKLMSIELMMQSNHLFLCCPLLFLPSVFPALGSFPVSQLFASGGQSVRGFSFSISLSNEYSGLIALGKWPRVDGLTVQGTLKSLLQHHRLKASIFQCSVFFMVHLSHLWASLVAQLVKNLPAM